MRLILVALSVDFVTGSLDFLPSVRCLLQFLEAIVEIFARVGHTNGRLEKNKYDIIIKNKLLSPYQKKKKPQH